MGRTGLIQKEQDEEKSQDVQAAHQIKTERHAIRIADPATEQGADSDTAGQRQIEDAHQLTPLFRGSQVTDVRGRDGNNEGHRNPLEESAQGQVPDVGGRHIDQRHQAAEEQAGGNERLASVPVGQAANERHAQDLREGKAGKEEPDTDSGRAQRLGVNRHERNHDAHAEHRSENREVQTIKNAPVQNMSPGAAGSACG